METLALAVSVKKKFLASSHSPGTFSTIIYAPALMFTFKLPFLSRNTPDI